MHLVLTNFFVFLALVLYFDFMPARFITVSNSSISIKMYSKVADANYYKNLKIRPVAKNALVSAFSSEPEAWISQYAFSTHLPNYSHEVLIKPVFSGDYFLLSFEVLDTNTGKIYKTPEKKIWGLVLPKSVLSRLVTKTAPD